MGIPLLGERFPEIEVLTTHGKMKLPDAYKGKWLVLFSHPADFTPVCTTEFIGFQKRYDEFKKLGAELIGLSVDQIFSHIKWVEWIEEKVGVKIEFPIIADTGKVAETLGMIHPAKGSNTVRAVFIIDPNGLIRTILYYPQEVGRNIDEVLRIIKAFTVADANKVAIPANWPNNELFKDEVIVPPPTSIEEAMKRKQQYDCLDWWLCHKKV